MAGWRAPWLAMARLGLRWGPGHAAVSRPTILPLARVWAPLSAATKRLPKAHACSQAAPSTAPAGEAGGAASEHRQESTG